MKKLIILFLFCACASHVDKPIEEKKEKEVVPRFDRSAEVLKVDPKAHKKALNSLKPRN